MPEHAPRPTPDDAPRPAHRFVLASAGTGKTFYLTNRYMRLIAQGEDASEIVATTFTRKAAGEILERVTGRLAEGAAGDRGLRELRRHVAEGLDAPRCAALLRTLALDAQRLRILTLDAWLQHLASGLALDLGVAPGWRVAEEDEDLRLREQAVEQALEAIDAGRVGELVRLCSRGQAPMGAHRAVMRTIKDAYEAFVASEGRAEAWRSPSEIHGRLSEDELGALLETIRTWPVDVQVRTKKGEINKNFAKAAGNLLTKTRHADWAWLLENGLTAKANDPAPTYYGSALHESVVRDLSRLRAHAAAMVAMAHADATRSAYELLSAFDSSYQYLKRSRGMLRFDDVPRLLLEARPEDLGDLYYRLDARIRHVLLDEFQDTSHTQFELLRPVIEELLSQDEGGRSVLVVGDVKQSLYGWRGAEPGLLERLPARYDPDGRCTEHLSMSWRSSPVVLEAVNRVFAPIARNAALVDPEREDGGPAASGAGAFGATFREHSSATGDLPGVVRLLVEAEPPEGDAESRVWANARFIARRVRRWRTLAPQASIGVLTRKNKPIPEIVRALAQLGIPCRGERGNPLTDAAPCNVALSALLLADHPDDSAAAYHVSTSPMGTAIGLVGLMSDADRRRVSADLRERLMRDGLAGTIAALGRACAGAMTPRERARFAQLIELADQWAARTPAPDDGASGRLRFGGFVRWVRDRQVPEPREGAAPGGVSVMTVHHAKGLEFDAVVLTQLDDRWEVKPGSVLAEREPADGPVTRVALYPNKSERLADPALHAVHEMATARQVREELSVLYVAMTRARHALEMVVPWLGASGATREDDEEDGYTEVDGSKAPTSARVLRAALSDDPGDNGDWISEDPSDGLELFHEGGDDSAWAAHLEHAEREQAAPDARPSRRVRLRVNSGAGASRRPALVSPSKLGSGDRTAGGDAAHAGRSALLWGAPDDAGFGRTIGTLVHAWFGRVGWIEDGLPSEDALRRAGAAAGVPESHPAWTPARAAYEHAIASEPVRQALSKARYDAWTREGLSPEVRPEWAIVAVVPTDAGEATVVRGQIDRLVLGRDPSGRVRRASVLDFKTDRMEGSPEAVTLEAAAARHAPQLRTYAEAVARAFGVPLTSIDRAIVLTAAARVIEMDQTTPDRSARRAAEPGE